MVRRNDETRNFFEILQWPIRMTLTRPKGPEFAERSYSLFARNTTIQNLRLHSYRNQKSCGLLNMVGMISQPNPGSP